MQIGRRRILQGFGFVAVLILLAVTSLGLSMAGQSWAQSSKREKELEMLRIGQLYVQALQKYREMSPGAKILPMELQDLLLDKRFVGTVRHMRQLYPDPLRHAEPWGILRDGDGRVIGVFSLSEEEPLSGGGVRRADLVLPPVSRYSDWKFVVNTKL